MIHDEAMASGQDSAMNRQSNRIAGKETLLDLQVFQRIALTRDWVDPVNLTLGRELIVRHPENLEPLNSDVAGFNLDAVCDSPKRIGPAHPCLRQRHNGKQHWHSRRSPIRIVRQALCPNRQSLSSGVLAAGFEQLESEQITHLDEHLAPDWSGWRAYSSESARGKRVEQEVLAAIGVSHIERGSRIYQVGQQKVSG